MARDGNDCGLCKKSFQEETPAEVHHKDGDSYNNPRNGSNWQLVHHSCNVLQFYVQKRLGIIDQERPPPFEYAIGTKMELQWLRWMIDQITKNKNISWNEARYTGALEIDGSPETTKRYLMKQVVDSDHPKALFKTELDEHYNTKIVFTSHIQDFIDSNQKFQ